MDNLKAYADRKAALETALRAAEKDGGLSLRKRTSSNLYRYQKRERGRRSVDMSGFNHVLEVDAQARILDVEGLATFETIIDHTLPHGLSTLVTPELKHITIGGATVGIGIESNCFRHGFVHDALVWAEVLLPDGRIVPCSATENADLFRALPNSYGTLGYVLRAKVRLQPARHFVHLHTDHYRDTDLFLEAMRKATEGGADFVEALIFGPDKLFLTVSRFAEQVPRQDDILRGKEFYRLVCEQSDVYLSTRDYLFRYDPDWFWNLPEGFLSRMFRRWAPASLRHSSFYKRYMDFTDRLPWKADDGKELLIQDWEVPWEKSGELLRYAMANVDLGGKPWLVVPIRTRQTPTLYPVRPDTLYFNLGCYCRAPKPKGGKPFQATLLLDRKCFELGGLKMLYSSTFLEKAEFDGLYNGEAYAALKAKYDPQGRLLDLYRKCVRAPERLRPSEEKVPT